MEKISIIIPVYNVENYIDECLKSVVNQTYKNIQIIIVNDGSTDNSGIICDQWAEVDSRISVYHKKNGGLSSARNVGLAEVSGGYIVFVDSDDVLDLDFCSIMLSALNESRSYDIVACSIAKFIDPDISNYKTFYKYSSQVLDVKDFWSLILRHKADNAVWGKMFRKEILDQYFRAGILNEDLIYFLDITPNIRKIKFLDESLYYYRIRKGSITNQVSPKISDFFDNAMEVKKKMRLFNWNLEAESQGFLLTEITNIIATIEKFNVRSHYSTLYQNMHNVIKDSSSSFNNRYWSLSKKIKYILVNYFPFVYRFLIKIKNEITRSN